MTSLSILVFILITLVLKSGDVKQSTVLAGKTFLATYMIAVVLSTAIVF